MLTDGDGPAFDGDYMMLIMVDNGIMIMEFIIFDSRYSYENNDNDDPCNNDADHYDDH